MEKGTPLASALRPQVEVGVPTPEAHNMIVVRAENGIVTSTCPVGGETLDEAVKRIEASGSKVVGKGVSREEAIQLCLESNKLLLLLEAAGASPQSSSAIETLRIAASQGYIKI